MKNPQPYPKQHEREAGMKIVYLDLLTGEFSFECKSPTAIAVGETDGQLEEWTKWHEDNFKESLTIKSRVEMIPKEEKK